MYLSTGLPELDMLLGGGIPTGGLTIISGPPHSGKTNLAQKIVDETARNYPVCVFDPEGWDWHPLAVKKDLFSDLELGGQLLSVVTPYASWALAGPNAQEPAWRRMYAAAHNLGTAIVVCVQTQRGGYGVGNTHDPFLLCDNWISVDDPMFGGGVKVANVCKSRSGTVGTLHFRVDPLALGGAEVVPFQASPPSMWDILMDRV